MQAVAARTYALATRKTSGAFDQYPDTRSQVYRGVTGESVRSDAAVRDTARQDRHLRRHARRDLLLLDLGRPHGEHRVLVRRRRSSKPWLVGVPDPYDTSRPTTAGPCGFSAAALDRALRAPGRFKRMKVLERGVSPRVVRAQVVGTRGTRSVTGPQIRSALGLRDTWFTDYRVSTSSSRTPTAGRAWSGRARAGGRGRTARVLAGQFQPAPRAHVLGIERRGRRPVALRRSARARHAPGATASHSRARVCTAWRTAR